MAHYVCLLGPPLRSFTKLVAARSGAEREERPPERAVASAVSAVLGEALLNTPPSDRVLAEICLLAKVLRLRHELRVAVQEGELFQEEVCPGNC